MVTAEVAVALPALVVLLAFALTAVAVISAQLRCVDAAREAARAAARGDDGGARGYAAATAPRGASIFVSSGPGQVRAVVRAVVRPVGTFLPGFTVSATAVALREPGRP